MCTIEQQPGVSSGPCTERVLFPGSRARSRAPDALMQGAPAGL